MAIPTIRLKDYEKLPIIYNQDGEFDDRLKLGVGDFYIMREPENIPDIGDVVSVYKIIHTTKYSNESKIEVLRIER